MLTIAPRAPSALQSPPTQSGRRPAVIGKTPGRAVDAHVNVRVTPPTGGPTPLTQSARPRTGHQGPDAGRIAAAVPAGWRAVTDRTEVLAIAEAAADTALIRADKRVQWRALFEAMTRWADWDTGVVTVPRATLADTVRALTGRSMSPRTVTRYLAEAHAAGWLVTVEKGASARAMRRAGVDHARAASWLVIAPVDQTGQPSLTDPGSCSVGRNSSSVVTAICEKIDHDHNPAELPGAGTSRSARTEERQEAIRFAALTRSRADRMAATKALIRRCGLGNVLTVRRTEKALRRWYAAGWSARAILWAVDHRPDGQHWSTRVETKATNPLGVLLWRLSHWADAGTPLAAPIAAPSAAETALNQRLAARDDEALEVAAIAERVALRTRNERAEFTRQACEQGEQRQETNNDDTARAPVEVYRARLSAGRVRSELSATPAPDQQAVEAEPVGDFSVSKARAAARAAIRATLSRTPGRNASATGTHEAPTEDPRPSEQDKHTPSDTTAETVEDQTGNETTPVGSARQAALDVVRGAGRHALRLTGRSRARHSLFKNA